MKKSIVILSAITFFNTGYMMYNQYRTEKKIQNLYQIIDNKIQVKVTATMYNAVISQCDDTPLQTACMYKINPQRASEHKWIAVSRDLLKINGGHFEYGDKVVIKGAGKKDGIYTVADTMNKRFKNKIDILETKGTPLYKYENVMLAKL